MSQKRSSRERYRAFVRDYKRKRLDDGGEPGEEASAAENAKLRRGKRREYLRDYLRWLRPHRFGIVAVFVFAVIAAGLGMLEPLFMRFIMDRILLNTELDAPARLSRLNIVGALFIAAYWTTNEPA